MGWRFGSVVAASLLAGSALAQNFVPSVPTEGRAEVIGGPANGCIAGAVPLPLDGPGYQAIRVSRNRFWSHPDTIGFVQWLGAQVRARGFPPLYVGDLSQPRGGRMAYGHASHQSGVDADIWFSTRPKPDLPAARRENVDLPNLVRPDRSMDRAVFEPRHVELLRIAVSHPRVDRIFVNFVIKHELCRSVRGDRSWLRRIRPWLGHDSHFHVRLRCPEDSPDCVAQTPVPPGDGCAEVEAWFRPPPRHDAGPSIPRPRPPPPARCLPILEQQQARR